ncbi:hypothetical protein [Anaeromassilibacillus senegalensis]|uniref:Uncharacterized protein n=1 Tax=Anaeromassilibacillus senegalensis TaxID=1673717 RepID=A0ABS9CLV8_9FIRM|nr:hypothetical protein [Anaeromassilibacillus senegalensis]MCF2651822.1 hypothetical protein [Anaeromassilibacillus senegalensis]
MLKDLFREMYIQDIRENGYEPTAEAMPLIDIAAELAAEAFTMGQFATNIEIEEGRQIEIVKEGRQSND